MPNNIFEKEWRALGTDIYLQLVTDSFSASSLEEVFLQVKNIYLAQEKTFSRFDAASELTKMNSSQGQFIEASPDMLAIAQKSLLYFSESDGLFDPRILETLEKIGYTKSFSENDFSGQIAPEENKKETALKNELIIENGRVKFLKRMDFSGLAKGYITDRVADFLRLQGFKDFLIDSGGDMFAAGKNSLGEKWGIALEGAQDEDETVLEISNEAVATSGNVRRHWERAGKKFHHLINPKHPDNFSFDLKSVTVIAETTEKADVMAKILFLLGLADGLEKADREKLRAAFLQADGSLIKSKYF